MPLSSARSVPQRERYVHKLPRDRLASIKPTVDCHTPSTVNMKHLAHRLKKKQLADGEKTHPLFQRESETSRRAPAEARPPTPHAARAGALADRQQEIALENRNPMEKMARILRGQANQTHARRRAERPASMRSRSRPAAVAAARFMII